MNQSKFSIGILGGGNMAEAILKGALENGVISPDQVMVSDVVASRLTELKDRYHVQVTPDNAALVAFADILLLAIKPQVAGDVLSKLAMDLANKALISIMAGIDSTTLHLMIGDNVRILRVMPNTCGLVGSGMSVLSKNHTLLPEEYAFADKLFGVLGEVMTLDEHHFHAVTAVSGSGPAYVFMIIEAMADGGVLQGLPRDAAIKLAAQTVFGAAAMVKGSGKHPAVLKDAVCSPGGTTIEAVRSLERDGLRSAMIEAVRVCADKSKLLGKKE